jgi:hypothetical protein
MTNRERYRRSKAEKLKPGPSMFPQHVNFDVFYFETRTGIDVYVDKFRYMDNNLIHFKIGKSKLKRSLKRMETPCIPRLSRVQSRTSTGKEPSST